MKIVLDRTNHKGCDLPCFGSERLYFFAWYGGLILTLCVGCGGFLETAQHHFPVETVKDETNLGEQYAQTAITKTISVVNNSNHDLPIEQFVTSCNCVDIQPPRLVIPRRSTQSVDLCIEMPSTLRFSSPLEKQSLRVTVTPISRHRDKRIAHMPIELTGSVVPPLLLDPPEFRAAAVLGQTPSDHSTKLTSGIIVRLTEIVTIDELTTSCDKRLGTVELHRGVNKEHRLVFSPSRTAIESDVPQLVYVSGRLSNGHALKPIPIPVRIDRNIAMLDPDVIMLHKRKSDGVIFGAVRVWAIHRQELTAVSVPNKSKVMEFSVVQPTLDSMEWKIEISARCSAFPFIEEVIVHTVNADGIEQDTSLVVVAQ
jgi:hypothetical protein